MMRFVINTPCKSHRKGRLPPPPLLLNFVWSSVLMKREAAHINIGYCCSSVVEIEYLPLPPTATLVPIAISCDVGKREVDRDPFADVDECIFSIDRKLHLASGIPCAYNEEGNSNGIILLLQYGKRVYSGVR